MIQIPTHAITLHRPWPEAILFGGKDFENRTWLLPSKFRNVPIALHAGKTYDEDAAIWMILDRKFHPLDPEDSPVGIVGVIMFGNSLPRSGWYFGPYGWPIIDRATLAEPIVCRGYQGFWKLTDEQRDAIWRQF